MLRRIKIRKRLLLINLVMIAVTLSILYMGHKGLNRVNTLITSMYEANLKPSLTITNLKADLMGIRATLLAMMNESVRSKQEGFHNQIKDLSSRIDSSFAEVLKSEYNAIEEKGKLEELKNVWGEFRETRDEKLIPFIYSGDIDSAKGLATGIQAERFKRMTSLSNEIVKKMTEGANMAKDGADKISSNSIALLWWVSIAGIIIAGVLNIFIGLSITKPLQLAIDSLKDIAAGEGDLTRRLKIESTDEIGELSHWFNTFTEKIHDIIVHVNARAFSVSSASEELSASATQIAKGSQTQTEKATTVATSSEEMSSTIVEVAKNASGASEAARKSNKIAQKGKEIVERTVDGMNSIAKSVEESASVITQLGTSSNKIGEIIKVIDDIADQTNLLALNAAIEAARAGEHGRGFAVVADEVRKLAEKTTKATKEIGGMIGTIQDETGKAVTSMGEVTKDVKEKVGLAKEAGNTLGEIVSNVDILTTMIQQIAVASEEQSAATDTISKDIQDIANTTKETSTSSTQIADASNDLSKLASELQSMLSKFRTKEDTKALI